VFYEREMAFRQGAGYPPAGGLLAVHMSCPDKDHLVLGAGYVRKFLERVKGEDPMVILGPVDEPVARIADVWRMVLYMKGTGSAPLRRARGWLEKYIEINPGFSSIDITYETTI
jgi:primosomal protein N' (replication factor Y)